MKYDHRRTGRHKAESKFIIHGYLEQMFCKGRQIYEKRHDAIPYGIKLGYTGASLMTVKIATKYKLRGGVFTARPGDIIRREVIAICGRIKK